MTIWWVPIGAQIQVLVTNGDAFELYRVFVTPVDTTLSALSLTDGSGNAVTLDPTFVAGTREYTASVANSVSTVTAGGDGDRQRRRSAVAFMPEDGGH